jgi:hypothetical protein
MKTTWTLRVIRWLTLLLVVANVVQVVVEPSAKNVFWLGAQSVITAIVVWISYSAEMRIQR